MKFRCPDGTYDYAKISNILFKLGLRDRTQLAIWAVQTGVVNQPL